MNGWGELHRRLTLRALALGFESLSAFADAQPLEPWVDLWARLGEPTGNALQLYDCLLAEAILGGRTERFVRSALVRDLLWKLPAGGWTDAAERSARRGWSLWCGQFGEWALVPGLEVFRDLQRSHADGWRPSGPDDTLIVAAFANAKFPFSSVSSPVADAIASELDCP